MPASGSDNGLSTFSIVIPSHNRKAGLALALSHIGKQTYPAELIEVVVVLDGCTDGSAAMLENLRAEFPFRLQVLEQAQGGPARARNTGVRAAQGEYILFLDDDVRAIPELVMEHYRTHQAHPNTVVIGTMSRPTHHRRPVWVRWEEYILEAQYQDLLQGRYELSPRQFYTGNGSLKREWLMEAGLFDESFKRYEDVELAFRLERLNLGFKFNPAATGYHYASRSYQSWTHMHYLYGHYAVKLGRDKGLSELIDSHLEEFGERHWLTRMLSTQLLNHKKMQQIASFGLLKVAELAALVKQERRAYQALSCVANILFWQGFNEELYPASPKITPTRCWFWRKGNSL